jgi:hypothetical protein
VDDADEQDDRKEADGVVEHIGYGRRGGEFRPVEWNAIWAKQNGTGAKQTPDQESDPEAWLTDKVLET